MSPVQLTKFSQQWGFPCARCLCELRNMKIADELGFLTPANRDLLRRGNAQT
jgi:hypothetical protein